MIQNIYKLDEASKNAWQSFKRTEEAYKNDRVRLEELKKIFAFARKFNDEGMFIAPDAVRDVLENLIGYIHEYIELEKLVNDYAYFGEKDAVDAINRFEKVTSYDYLKASYCLKEQWTKEDMLNEMYSYGSDSFPAYWNEYEEETKYMQRSICDTFQYNYGIQAN